MRGLIDAAYHLEPKVERWLDTLAVAAREGLDGGFGVLAYEFWVGPDGVVRPHVPVARGASLATIGAFLAAIHHANRGVLQRSHIDDGPYSSLSQAMGRERLARDPRARLVGDLTGIRDFVAVKGVDVDGSGIAIGAPLPQLHRAKEKASETWALVGAHMTAARRLRRQRARAIDGLPEGAAAVLDARGRLVHAEGDAVANRGAIVEGAKRRSAALSDVDANLSAWTALLNGRWSLAEFVDADRRRFIVAVRNVPPARNLRGLSERERAIVAYAALGRSPKLVAYELGLSTSTVRTLERRAMSKLGVATRAELVSRYLAARYIERLAGQPLDE